MSSPSDAGRPITEMEVHKENLYREEMITDLHAVTLRRMVPIGVDGADDPSRPVLFMGETQVMTGGGLLPISARIEATTIEEALDAFPQAINQAIEEMVQRARELQREEANRIVVPGQGGGGMPPGFGGSGGGGGGLIR